MRRMFITAMLPPGNIQAQINEVKTKLFSKFGFASMYALPPIVPIMITDNPIDQPELHAVIRQSCIVSASGATIEHGHVVLHVKPIGICDHIRNQITGVDPVETATATRANPYIPNVESLLLGVHEGLHDRDKDAAVRRFLANSVVGDYRWKRSELVCLELTAEQQPWWTSMRISYHWRYPLKSTAAKHS